MDKKNILIAIDDPDWSGIIVHTLFNFIKPEKYKITLLNILETTLAEEEFFYKEPEKFISYESRKTKFAYIEHFLDCNNLEYKLLFEEGDAAEHVVETSKNLKTDLVVVGSHNKKIFERLFLGSVAYKALRLCPCPVLVVSSKYHIHNIRKKNYNVLLTVDGSEPSFDAVRGMADIIDIDRAKINLLHAKVPPQEVIPPEAQLVVDMAKIQEEANAVSAEILDRAADELEKIGVSHIEKLSLLGKPAKTIIDYAEHNPIDLIVMGSLGKKDLPKLLIGSTSSKVSERTEVPLLVVKKQMH